ncbi:MAG: bacillithiol biosynthesis cysteine-adding enzyme BshC [Acidobacteriota bacterium]|nr:bacillithiol biosynthesis cysteine-adding enzyme BshC [Acidobacteriota bacterium]
MECTCVRQTDLPNTTKLFSDLIYRFDRVADLYPWKTNDLASIEAAAKFDYPDDRRADLIRALTPGNQGNPSLEILAQPGTVAIVTGQQVGLFSGPAYTVYKALSAIRIARELNARGTRAVPVFWLATEDHDFAEVNQAWVFGSDRRPVRLQADSPESSGTRPVGGLPLDSIPISELRAVLNGLPFAEEAAAIVERAYRPGATMGEAFAAMVRELFAPYGLLIVDPMSPAIRKMAAPFMRTAVERMPELIGAVIAKSKELVERGYHAQVLVDAKTSLAFLLENGHRTTLKRTGYSLGELADKGESLSPNALLRPVLQDYLLPTAAYVGGPAELAYFAQSRVIYDRLLGRQPVAAPRSSFTLLDARSAKHAAKYGLGFTDLFTEESVLREKIADRVTPPSLAGRLNRTASSIAAALDALEADLKHFDVSLAAALGTSRGKIEYQAAKIARKTRAQMLVKDAQASRDAASLSGLAYPEGHLQERLYSIVPFLAAFGPGLIGELYEHVRIECPDHQVAVLS